MKKPITPSLEKAFPTIFEQSPISTQVLAITGETVRVNKAWERLWGLTLNSLKGYNILRDPQLIEEKVTPLLQRAFKGEVVAIHPIKYYPKKTLKGVTSVPFRWTKALAYPIKDTNGKIIYVVLQHEDITEQKMAEEKLQASENRFRKILEHSTDAITLIDKMGKRIYSTPSRKNILGYDSADDYGESIFTNVHPDDQQRVEKAFNEVAGHLGSSKTMTFRVKHGNGHWIWLEVSGTNLLHIPYIEAVVINYRDVTDRKVLEQQKDDFLGIASHELKTPVTSLKAYAQVLERDFTKRGDVKAASLLEKMDSQINKLTSLINDLLDINKIEGGRLKLTTKEFSVDELVREVVEEVQRTTEKHKITITGSTNTLLVADRERVGQVLTNYLTNAIKYSPYTKNITVRLRKREKEVEVSVVDKGIGIPKESLHNIFTRFYRVKADKRETIPGIGLGLYISSEIIKRLGGRYWVESIEGKGSTFYFTLPS